MAERPVVILGAGASMETDAPGLNAILPSAFRIAPAQLHELDAFLRDYFHCVGAPRGYPSLPLVLGILDTALDRKQDLGPTWGLDRLRKVRTQVGYAIFAVLKDHRSADIYHRLIEWLSAIDRDPVIISGNYDFLADDALIQHADSRFGEMRFPDYGCDIATAAYRNGKKYGSLYKLVGSLHWMECPACRRLDVLFPGSDNARLDNAYGDAQLTCGRINCGAIMQPVIVTPTLVREQSGPHIDRVRYTAERALQQADAAIFIGYAMKDSDLDVNYLLQRGLSSLPPEKITVVAGDYDHVRRNYRDVFGSQINWTRLTFGKWMNTTGPVASY